MVVNNPPRTPRQVNIELGSTPAATPRDSAAGKRGGGARALLAMGSFLPRYVLRASASHRTLPFSESLTTAVLFLDVSGFTKLSQALAHKGGRGAAGVASYLNQYFSQLVKIVNRNGGDIVKFAGDARIIVWGEATEEEPLEHLVRRDRQHARPRQRRVEGDALGGAPLRERIAAVGRRRHVEPLPVEVHGVNDVVRREATRDLGRRQRRWRPRRQRGQRRRWAGGAGGGGGTDDNTNATLRASCQIGAGVSPSELPPHSPHVKADVDASAAVVSCGRGRERACERAWARRLARGWVAGLERSAVGVRVIRGGSGVCCDLGRPEDHPVRGVG